MFIYIAADSAGIAPTKTLAKLANHAVMAYPATDGVVDLTNPVRQSQILSLIPVDEVWGVGPQLSTQLGLLGIDITLKLADTDPKWTKQQFHVVLERTVHELNGLSGISLEEVTQQKKQLISSHSFGERITDKQVMSEAIASYAVRATEKLRFQKQYARSLTVFIRTNPFSLTIPMQQLTNSLFKLMIPVTCWNKHVRC